jgi:hypothetical protein
VVADQLAPLTQVVAVEALPLQVDQILLAQVMAATVVVALHLQSQELSYIEQVVEVVPFSLEVVLAELAELVVVARDHSLLMMELVEPQIQAAAPAAGLILEPQDLADLE